MRRLALATLLLATAALPAAANTCVAGKLLCATKMPVGGYCECAAHGQTLDGTVFAHPPGKTNSTAGGCGINPTAPGC